MTNTFKKTRALAFFLLCLTSCILSNLLIQDASALEPTTDWNTLQHTSIAKLNTELLQSTDPVTNAWIRLALISKQYSNNHLPLIQQLKHWRAMNPDHPGNSLFPDDSTLSALEQTPPPQHIALLLPMQGQYGKQGQSIRDGFLSAYYASSTKLSAEQTVAFYDTSNHPISEVYKQAITDGADIIVGPLTKAHVQTLAAQNDLKATILALNYTDNQTLPNNMYEFGLSSKDEAMQAAEAAHDAGLSNAIIIAANDEWGQRTSAALISEWKAFGGNITETYYFSSSSNLTQDIANLMHVDRKSDHLHMLEDNNKELLMGQRRQDFDVVFMISQPPEARAIVPLLNYYYASNVPIYSTSAIYSGAPMPQKDADLNGVNFCDIPWIVYDAGAHLAKNLRYNRFYAVGRDAYLISLQLPRLQQLPNFPIYAGTGALSMGPEQQIYRRLSWATIHDGHI